MYISDNKVNIRKLDLYYNITEYQQGTNSQTFMAGQAENSTAWADNTPTCCCYNLD